MSQDSGFGGGMIHIIREDIPAAKHQIIQLRQRDKFIDFGGAVLCAFAQTDRPHLSERTDRFALAFADRQYTGDKRAGHGSQSRQQDT